jgi:hypothetical protein
MMQVSTRKHCCSSRQTQAMMASVTADAGTAWQNCVRPCCYASTFLHHKQLLA